MPASLRRNLLRTLAVPTLLIVVAAGGLAYGTAKAVVGAAYDQNLVNLAHGVAGHVHLHEAGIELALSREAEMVLRTDTLDRIFFRVRDDTGAILGGDADLPVPGDPGEASAATATGRRSPIPAFIDLDYRDEAIRAVRLYRPIGQRGVNITVAETLNKRSDALDRLLLGLGSAVALLLAAVAVAARFGIPSGLSPLARLEHSLATRSGTDLSPIDPANVPVEIREVVRSLNGLLERLRAANAAQRHFLQDAAHQLRTPLAGLQVQLELLRNGADAAAIGRLRLSVARLTRLANQLLALARAESGQRLVAEASPIELAPLIDALVEDWVQLADQKNIDLGVQRDPVTMTGDPTMLQELIANLMDNALKYTPAGGCVTLRCAAGNDAVDIEVVDDGPGIPEAARERAFERFYRLPDAGASGSGLGLAIAREIAHCHGGSIVLGDGPGGCGTRVRVRLPL